METIHLTETELAVLNVIKEQPLTSFQILKKVESIRMILSLYTIIDELKSKGIVNSYVEQNQKYHYAS
ncbi:MAG: PadR family transcriptional regulator [Polaribacter sp.]|nr:PadR family transcriptional regulator [Polaribacter sp.]